MVTFSPRPTPPHVGVVFCGPERRRRAIQRCGNTRRGTQGTQPSMGKKEACAQSWGVAAVEVASLCKGSPIEHPLIRSPPLPRMWAALV